MSTTKIRRCFITCKADSVGIIQEIAACTQFMSGKGKVYGIISTTAAYNTQTKEATIYIESERVAKEFIEEKIQSMGVTSAIVHTFSAGNWGLESFEAVSKVKSCSGKDYFVLIETGLEPQAWSYVDYRATHSTNTHFKNQGIYVLRLDNNKPNPCFYVGKATNIAQRIQQHEAGTGAFCISGEPFTRVESLTRGERLFFVGWIAK